MYNKRLDRLVLIDYGLSTYSKKGRGYKCITKYMGTFHYVCT